jgi:hypothetical protein
MHGDAPAPEAEMVVCHELITAGHMPAGVAGITRACVVAPARFGFGATGRGSTA